MKSKVNFGIIGGDLRQVYLAKSIQNDGYSVKLCGFENLDSIQNLNCSIDELISCSNYIILPMPVTKDNVNINAPMSNRKIRIDNITDAIDGKHIFSGNTSSIPNFNNIKVYDYSGYESFAILNAIPTAEAAIQIAISNRVHTLYKSKCLISGFGQIGKVLSKILYAMGADLTVSARKMSDLAWIKSLGYRPIKTYEIKNSGNYDVIFNTVPYRIFDKSTLIKCTHSDTLIIDLASVPGGVDFESAKDLNINTIHALALPGKFAPQSAGEFIKQTIYDIIKEENLYE